MVDNRDIISSLNAKFQAQNIKVELYNIGRR
jgi:hypothetical protein